MTDVRNDEHAATSDGRLRIRTASSAEHEAVRELTRAAYAEYEAIMQPDAWAALANAIDAALSDPHAAEWIVAIVDERIVGSVLLFPAAAAAYGAAIETLAWPELRLLAVAPDGRGRGVGRALVEECVRRARAAGAAALGLHTSRSMAAARRMYERLGFRRAPELDFQPPGAELVEGFRIDLV